MLIVIDMQNDFIKGSLGSPQAERIVPKVTIDARACAGVTEQSHKAALLTMKMCQVNVINE